MYSETVKWTLPKSFNFMDRTMEKTEFEQMRDKALEQLMKGQSLTDKMAFSPLYFNNF